jgi:hypothetical protein
MRFGSPSSSSKDPMPETRTLKNSSQCVFGDSPFGQYSNAAIFKTENPVHSEIYQLPYHDKGKVVHELPNDGLTTGMPHPTCLNQFFHHFNFLSPHQRCKCGLSWTQRTPSNDKRQNSQKSSSKRVSSRITFAVSTQWTVNSGTPVRVWTPFKKSTDSFSVPTTTQ